MSSSDDRESVSQDAWDEDKGQSLEERPRFPRAGRPGVELVTCHFSVT